MVQVPMLPKAIEGFMILESEARNSGHFDPWKTLHLGLWDRTGSNNRLGSVLDGPGPDDEVEPYLVRLVG